MLIREFRVQSLRMNINVDDRVNQRETRQILVYFDWIYKTDLKHSLVKYNPRYFIKRWSEAESFTIFVNHVYSH